MATISKDKMLDCHAEIKKKFYEDYAKADIDVFTKGSSHDLI